MRPQPFVVHLRRQADAKCVAEALAPHSASIERTRGTWDVHVDIRSRALGDLLTALHECLVTNEIAQVRITVDGKPYAMEARSDSGSRATHRSV